MTVGEMGRVNRCESLHRRADADTDADADADADAEKLVPIARPVEAYAHVIPRVDATRERSKCYEQQHS
jgi:hypothetical protein